MTDIVEITDTIHKIGATWSAAQETLATQAKEIKRLGTGTTETAEKLARIEAELDHWVEHKERLERLETAMRRPPQGDAQRGDTLNPHQRAHKDAFNGFLRRGVDAGLPELEKKALSVGNDPDGGYLVPTDTSGRIYKRIFDSATIRRIATVVEISTDAVEGLRDSDDIGAGWVAEAEDRPETSTSQFGRYRIPVFEMYAEPRATQQMLDDASLDVEAWLADKLADRFLRLENAAFVNGDGSAQPRGFLSYPTAATADAARLWGVLEHIGTGVNGDFAAANPADVLLDLIAALKPGYLANAAWVTRRAVIARIRKFKESTTNAYLWQPGLQQGQPATLLGFPVTLEEEMPALAAGSFSVAFGDFREGYQIVDRVGVRTLRDPFTAKPFVKFYTTKRVGGAVVNFDAIKLIRFA
jgi:HK97 family phage major capsid protein